MPASYTFDQFNPISTQEYWQSANGSPVPGYIQEIYEKELLARNFAPQEASSWKAGDFIGGIKRHKNRCCLFRIYNGGRDMSGRPDRWVMLVLEDSASNLAGTDVIAALKSPFFENFKKPAMEKTRELKPPQADLTWERTPVPTEDAVSKNSEISGSNAENEIRRESEIFTSLPQSNGFILIRTQGGVTSALADYSVPAHPTKNKKAESPSNALPWVIAALCLLIVLSAFAGGFYIGKTRGVEFAIPVTTDQNYISTAATHGIPSSRVEIKLTHDARNLLEHSPQQIISLQNKTSALTQECNKLREENQTLKKALDENVIKLYRQSMHKAAEEPQK